MILALLPDARVPMWQAIMRLHGMCIAAHTPRTILSDRHRDLLHACLLERCVHHPDVRHHHTAIPGERRATVPRLKHDNPTCSVHHAKTARLASPGCSPCLLSVVSPSDSESHIRRDKNTVRTSAT